MPGDFVTPVCNTAYIAIWKGLGFKWQIFWTVCQVNKECVCDNRILKADDSKPIMSMLNAFKYKR